MSYYNSALFDVEPMIEDVTKLATTFKKYADVVELRMNSLRETLEMVDSCTNELDRETISVINSQIGKTWEYLDEAHKSLAQACSSISEADIEMKPARHYCE